MRSSVVEDIDGEQFPDPLTIDYQGVVDRTLSLPSSYSLKLNDLKRLPNKFYEETGEVYGDDILYSVNGIEHVGVLEPEDSVILYNFKSVKSFDFVDLP